MTDELLIRVLTRLLRVHDELGDTAFQDAAHRALVSIAMTVQVEADRRAGVGKPTGQDVIPFPIATSLRLRAKPPA